HGLLPVVLGFETSELALEIGDDLALIGVGRGLERGLHDVGGAVRGREADVAQELDAHRDSEERNSRCRHAVKLPLPGVVSENEAIADDEAGEPEADRKADLLDETGAYSPAEASSDSGGESGGD